MAGKDIQTQLSEMQEQLAKELRPAATDEQLLMEVEDLIRNKPDIMNISDHSEESLNWLGRVTSTLYIWDKFNSISVIHAIESLHNNYSKVDSIVAQIMITLNRARHELVLKTIGPESVAINGGKPFDYFDVVRKKIELATNDIFFIDPYLDAEFVSNYLCLVKAGVSIRLLAREKLATLIPAVNTFNAQHGKGIQVRSHKDFHDRYLLVDKQHCYQSGASFKDGAKVKPTTLTQITDAFDAVKVTYEDLWDRSKVEI